MLVLCSDGLSGGNLRRAVQVRLDGRKTAALVVTADHVYKERNRHVDRCRAELESLGLSVETVDIDVSPAEELLRYDVVEFIGGNPFYLMQSIRRHAAQDALGSLAQTGILIGWSAAAFAFGPTLELVYRYSPEMSFQGMTDLQGCALTQVEVLPHYSRFLHRFDAFEERCCAYEAARGVKVIRLDDGEGVIIDGEDMEICRL